jgi:putative spermidine/putrescine transport system ATP-binding protein
VVPGLAPDGVNQFIGRLARDRFLGSLRRYDFDTDLGSIAGETPMPDTFDAIHIPPGAVRLLPPVTATPTSTQA